MTRRGLQGTSLALALVIASTQVAFAHTRVEGTFGFFTGFMHPIRGLDHVVAMVAVGLWGAQLGKPSIWILPITFPVVMAVGGFLGLMSVPLPGVEIGIALSGVLLGLAVLTETRPPLALAAILVGFFAIFHGYAHGAELPLGENALLYSLGFVIGTSMLHAVGIAIGTMYQWPWGKLTVRTAGGIIGIVGANFLWSALA